LAAKTPRKGGRKSGMLSKKQIVKGTRVIYTSDAFDEAKSNPLWGGKYGKIVGTITGIDHKKDPYIGVVWDNGTSNSYDPTDLTIYEEGKIKMIETAETTVAKLQMIETAETTVAKLHQQIKPFEKYIGLVALAMVIDHFLLGNKFSSRFKSIAEGLVDKIAGSLDKLIEKLKVDDGPEDSTGGGTRSEA
jgi:hypothetical protein